ncbi:hypothetical protein QBC40DRAFT_267126 [Triangularia verruculosa]|uniref:Cyclin-dependent kinase n=1 Tax=Triangularia verruculosa TaxID=2587418 RepID=A0AAN6XEA4_9PEZI|nr:hypothetical protein QBC40DRAFT_267126 [Triangularia verruculosa]
MGEDSTSNPPRVHGGRVGDKDSKTFPLSAPDRGVDHLHGKMQPQNDTHHQIQPTAAGHAQGAPDATQNQTPTTRDRPAVMAAAADDTSQQQQAAPYYPLATSQPHPLTVNNYRQPTLQRSDSQESSSTIITDRVFTPPASGGGVSPGTGSAHQSSQGSSQLLQLSQIAAAQERIPENMMDPYTNGASSRKRMADGAVKDVRDKQALMSPGQTHLGGHSRNPSAVSVASTTGSRVGEVSAELKARLSYAMVKVNRGWQTHSIDEVEDLASKAASPASSNSTIHLRNGASSSPQLSGGSQRASNNTTPATGFTQQLPGRLGDPYGRDSLLVPSRGSSTSPVKHTAPGLAPPVSIQPSLHSIHPRRHSNPRLTSSLLSASYQASSYPGPLSPGQLPGYASASQHRPSLVDTMGFSPHQNNAEKDAIESLLFMSSPGNSANLKHAFPSSSQPLPSGHTGPSRTALPTGRRTLPSSRPMHHARSQSQVQKRVGFEKPITEMEIDEPHGTPRGTARRRMNGVPSDGAPPRVKHLPVSAGLSLSSKPPRPVLADAEIDRMLEAAAAAADSDSDSEIQLPVRKARRDGAQPVVA